MSDKSHLINTRVLVAVESYPDLKGTLSLTYAHTRNKYYKRNGIDVQVLSFSCDEDYVIDDIPVMSIKSYKRNPESYEVLICHAANLRNHFFFLRKYGDKFTRFIFFFHGHEVLKVSKVYSKPYKYMESGKIKNIIRDLYDDLKLKVWHKYYISVVEKSQYIFVSKWMYEEFLKWTEIDPKIVEGRTCITYNCVGSLFEELRYDNTDVKEYDFITIRSNLDGSKYAIDVVNKMAQSTPQAKFLLIGKGKYFDINDKAKNITWMDMHFSAEEIIHYLSKARFALMPTRTDAQGVMMCEMAAYGIPVITSDIPVCHEVFDGFCNAFFISNEEQKNLNEFLKMKNESVKDERYFKRNTIEKEMAFIHGMGEK